MTGILAMALLSGCGRDSSSDSGRPEPESSMELAHAEQFSVDYYEGGIARITIADKDNYLLVPEGAEVPAWAEAEGDTVITQPLEAVYVASSSSMDMLRELDVLDHVAMTSTKAGDWAIPEIASLVEDGTITFIGKYSAPDYEAVLDAGSTLAIENTMILHNPEVKEGLESFGIPVLVEHSSYENDPEGRLEWIRLYGLLFGKQEEADACYASMAEKMDALRAETENTETSDRKRVAFFSVNTNGAATIRKPGDYVSRMIDIAGGYYVPDDVGGGEDDNALSTMNLQMESFYDACVDADILIYNSTIEGDLPTIDALIDKSEHFADFKAVKEGNVWCTNANVFQKTTGVCEMTLELNKIISGDPDDGSLQYFHKVE